LPVIESVKRELRTARRKQERNKSVRSLSKSALKKAEKTVESGGAEAKESVTAAISTLDRAAAKKILHRNNVARHKSRLMKKLNKAQAAAKPEAEKKTK
jgi:small subunit ribosomal protein S20